MSHGIHFVLGHKNPAAKIAFDRAVARYGQTPNKKATRLFGFGGDGTFLDMAHKEVENGRYRPIYVENYGSLGFLLNPPSNEDDDLVQILEEARPTCAFPLHAQGRTLKGKEVKRFAFNDIVVRMIGKRAPHLTVRTKKEVLYPRVWSDGFIVATPLGSSGYSASAGGDVVPPESHLMLLTPLAHMPTIKPIALPKQILPQAVTIELEEVDWRRAELRADGQKPTPNIVCVIVWQEAEKAVTLLHRKDFPLRERYRELDQDIRQSRRAAATPSLF